MSSFSILAFRFSLWQLKAKDDPDFSIKKVVLMRMEEAPICLFSFGEKTTPQNNRETNQKTWLDFLWFIHPWYPADHGYREYGAVALQPVW